MPRITGLDHQNTRNYIPIISNEFDQPLQNTLKLLEKRYFHKGWVVSQNFENMNYINAKFESIGFECLLKLNEKIIPRFALEFYSQLEFNYNSEGHFIVHFIIQNKSFSLTLKEFGHILRIPFEGHCSYSNKWSLDYLEISTPTKGLLEKFGGGFKQDIDEQDKEKKRGGEDDEECRICSGLNNRRDEERLEKHGIKNENVWVEMHSYAAWNKLDNQNLQNSSPSEINETYEPSPKMDSYEQPSCLVSYFVGETLRKSDQLHRTFEKSSIAMTSKLDDIIKFPKSQPKRTYNEDLECKIVMVKMPKCMVWFNDEPIGDLDTIKDKVICSMWNENVWVEMHSYAAWNKLDNQNLQNSSPSEINETYEPSPKMDSYEQPSCLVSYFVGETLRKSDQLHRTFEKSSIAMTSKLDDIIKFPKSQPKRTYNEDLECKIVMVKMPKCMVWFNDEPIEVEETIGIPIEVEPLDHMKLEDLGLNTNTYDLFLSSKGFPSVDKPEPQLLPKFSPLDVNLGDKRGTDPPSTHIVRVVLR
nr:DNA helicase Pif1-like protein [Tanacetum cinerariifolium]